jgi:hemerythrin-like domain-containing protein
MTSKENKLIFSITREELGKIVEAIEILDDCCGGSEKKNPVNELDIEKMIDVLSSFKQTCILIMNKAQEDQN